jgi:hypothetical protein
MARRRDHKAEHRRRHQLAVERGFRSAWEQRQAGRVDNSQAWYSALGEGPKKRRSQVLAAVAEGRERGVPVEVIAERRGLSMSAIRYWAGGALHPTTSDGTHVRPGDRLLRVRFVVFEGCEGFDPVAIRGSHKAQLAWDVFQTQWDFLHGQASAGDLAEYRGVRIGGRVVETDPRRLERLGAAGFDVELASRLVVS